jgi:hypothetical protein
MAKTFRKPVDKFERQARLAGHRNFHDSEQRELRNMQRMGWQPEMEDEINEEESVTTA